MLTAPTPPLRHNQRSTSALLALTTIARLMPTRLSSPKLKAVKLFRSPSLLSVKLTLTTLPPTFLSSTTVLITVTIRTQSSLASTTEVLACPATSTESSLTCSTLCQLARQPVSTSREDSVSSQTPAPTMLRMDSGTTISRSNSQTPSISEFLWVTSPLITI